MLALHLPQGKRMHLATMWLGICGLTIMAMLMARRVKGAIMVGECPRCKSLHYITLNRTNFTHQQQVSLLQPMLHSEGSHHGR